VSSTELKDPRSKPDSANPTKMGLQSPTALVAIDSEDPEVVPAALTSFVAAARHAHAAITVNGHYPPLVAVEAVEDVVAALARITTNVAPYAGDFSSKGGKAMTRAEALLVEARTELSDARHHLCLDEDWAMEAAVSAGQVTGSLT